MHATDPTPPEEDIAGVMKWEVQRRACHRHRVPDHPVHIGAMVRVAGRGAGEGRDPFRIV